MASADPLLSPACSLHLHLQSVLYTAEPAAATARYLVPFPLSLAGPMSTTSQQHTAPCLLAGSLPTTLLYDLEPVSKAGVLKPFADSVAYKAWPPVPSKTGPLSPSSFAPPLSPCCLSYSFLALARVILPGLFLLHKGHFWKSLFPTLLRLQHVPASL